MQEPSCEDKNKWKQDENDKKIEPVIRQFRRQQQFYGSTLATSSFRAFYNGTPRRAKSAEKLSTFEKNRSVGGGGGRGEQKQQLQQWNWGRCADRDTKVQNKLVNIDILQHWKDNIPLGASCSLVNTGNVKSVQVDLAAPYAFFTL